MHLPELIALGDYNAPAMPTEHALRGAWARLKRRVSGADDAPLLRHDGLEQASSAAPADIGNSPDCQPLLQALDKALGGWSRDSKAQPRLRLLVVPPCDNAGTLETWARTRGHALLRQPERVDLMGQAPAGPWSDSAGAGLLVIPALEQWFLRQRNGMHALRALLSRLAQSERRCVVGCDSWAWRYIVKSAGADLSLPRPQTFEPFDARRLCEWFSALARDSDGTTATFRLAGNGDDVLACTDDGEPCNAFLRQLAARSGGIPWVAWQLWRAGLRVNTGETPLSDRAAKATAGDARTVWVVDTDDANDIKLPPSNEDRSLLVLQALLIHAALTAAEIDAVLPATGEPDMLAALLASGHLHRDPEGGRYRVKPAAYPAVRRALLSADFPAGAL